MEFEVKFIKGAEYLNYYLLTFTVIVADIKLCLNCFSESGINVPTSWAPMGTTENIQIVPLTPGSTEYNQVETTFKAGGYQPTIVRVNNIQQYSTIKDHCNHYPSMSCKILKIGLFHHYFASLSCLLAYFYTMLPVKYHSTVENGRNDEKDTI